MDKPWISSDAWARALDNPDREAVSITVSVADPDLGTIALATLPDGREFYGADSPR
jgi:hypothetical protein